MARTSLERFCRDLVDGAAEVLDPVADPVELAVQLAGAHGSRVDVHAEGAPSPQLEGGDGQDPGAAPQVQDARPPRIQQIRQEIQTAGGGLVLSRPEGTGSHHQVDARIPRCGGSGRRDAEALADLEWSELSPHQAPPTPVDSVPGSTSGRRRKASTRIDATQRPMKVRKAIW